MPESILVDSFLTGGQFGDSLLHIEIRERLDMPRFIVKLPDGDQDYYLEWSTIVDAPITYGLSLEEFKEYYVEEYGKSSEDKLNERLTRVEEKGVSAFNYKDADELIEFNKAGEDGADISKEEIIERYCRNRDG